MEKKETALQDKIKKDQKAKKVTESLEREAVDLKAEIEQFAGKFEVAKRQVKQYLIIVLSARIDSIVQGISRTWTQGKLLN
jgi:hypothetical protein